MKAEKRNHAGESAEAQQSMFNDLRSRNERRANLAQFLDARRRARIERVMQAARERRLRHGR